MSRYVLLAHDHPYPHLDLMLEAADTLWTWRLEAPLPPGQPIRAVRVFDHRLIYLDYEGPISGGRGSVQRVDEGSFVWQEQGGRQAVVQVTAGHLTGTLRLQQIDGDVWEAEWRPAAAVSRGG